MNTGPSSAEAERSVLSVIIREPDGGFIGKAIEFGMTPKWFSDRDLGLLFGIMAGLEREGALDWVGIQHEAKKIGCYDRLGGATGLADLSGYFPHTQSFASHLAIIANAFIRRKTIHAASVVIETAMICDDGFKTASEAALEFAGIASMSVGPAELIPQKQALKMTLDEIEARQSGVNVATIETPWRKINEALNGGIGRGEITFVAARPSNGKTALGLNLLQRAAMDGHPGAFISLESGVTRLVSRVLSASSGLSVSKLAKEPITNDEMRILYAGMNRCKDLPIVWRKIHSATHHDVTMSVRKAVRDFGAQVVVIDYLQKLRSSDASEQHDMRLRMDNALDAVCPLADELGIALVILAQLNRQAEGVKGIDLNLAMLKETSRMEQDADVIMLIGPGSHESGGEDLKAMTVNILKSRDGAIAFADMQLHGPTTSFYD